jgi:hypothetical protein
VTLKFAARSADRSLLAAAEAQTMADAAPLQVKIVLAPAAGARSPAAPSGSIK